MDKLDMILDQLKEIKSSQERTEADIRALKNDNREIHGELKELNKKTDQTWMAVKEIRDELTENSVKIKIIDNKVRAL